MSEARFGGREREIDWENLSAPVPMDLIDPEFNPAGPAGTGSQILPRHESDALMGETGAGAPAEAAAPAFPGLGNAAAEPEFEPPAAPDPDLEPLPAGAGSTPEDVGSGTTLFGGITGEFNRIRAEMEAEAEAEKLRKQEAEQEEAAQRARLEQWMANARARLLKADADLTGPAGRVRIRKDSSPSLYRLAEMQKTMHFDGDATIPDGTRAFPAAPAPDPMATISVPTDQFLKLDAPAAPTLRDQALARAAVPPKPPEAPVPASSSASIQAPASVPAQAPAPVRTEAREAADPDPVPPAPAVAPAPPAPAPAPAAAESPRTVLSAAFTPAPTDASAFRPMTREEALTRKVAKLRRAAEAGENTLVGTPTLWDEGEGKALNFVIAGVVLVGLLVLGVGLFAATQAGLFDGLESRIPFLKPKVATAEHPFPPAAQAPAEAAPAGLAPGQGQTRPAASGTAVSGSSAGAPVPAARPASAVRAPEAAPKTAPSAARGTRPATLRAAPKPAPAPARPAAAHKAAVPARKNAQGAAAPDEEIPAYARPPDASANAEAALRNSVQAAVNADRESLRELYNSYALGFPGLSGEVVIGLTVDPSGRILEASLVSSTTGVATFDQDLLRKVVSWRLRSFPESRPKFVSVPFLFPMQGH